MFPKTAGDQTAIEGISANFKGTEGEHPSDTGSASSDGSFTAYFQWSHDNDNDGVADPGDHSKPGKHLVIREWWTIQAGGPTGTTATVTTPLGGVDLGGGIWSPSPTLPGKGDEITQDSKSGQRYTVISVPEDAPDSVIVHAPTRAFTLKASIAGYHENWNAAEGIIYPDGRASVGTYALYGAQVCDISLNAYPEGPYSIIKNLPDEKELIAYTNWRGRVTHDPNSISQLRITPFMGGVSDFDVTGLIKQPFLPDQDIFTNQKYKWDATGPLYIPVPYQASSAVTQWVRDAVDKDLEYHRTQIEQHPFNPLSWGSAVVDPIALVPDWWGQAWDDISVAQQAQNIPPEQKIETSTYNKSLYWDFDGDYDEPLPDTVVKAQITSQDPDSPVLPAGKATIHWRRPPQTYYEITVLPIEWQMRQEGNEWRTTKTFTLNNNPALQAELKKYATVTGITAGVTAIVTHSGSIVFRVFLAKPLASSAVARQIGNLLERLMPQFAEDAGLTADELANGKAKLTGQATEIGNSGAAVETSQDSRFTGGGATAEEKVPQTFKMGGGCFIAGTPVVMADGSLKPIEQVKAGDEVLSRDPLSGQVSGKKVSRPTVRTVEQTVLLHLADGQAIGATANHPIFVAAPHAKGGHEIVAAGRLALGTSILTRAGPSVALQNVDVVNRQVKVYNFTVADFHTYFVGKSAQSALWVHNTGPEDCSGLLASDPASGGATNTNFDPAQQEEIAEQISKLHPQAQDTRQIGEPIIDSLRQRFDVPNPGGFTTPQQLIDYRNGKNLATGLFFPEGSATVFEITNPTISSNTSNAAEIVTTFDNGAGQFANVPSNADWGEMGNYILNLEELNGTGTGYIRYFDAESQQLYGLKQRLDADPNLRGRFGICVTNEPCESCKNVISWWNLMSDYKDRVQVFAVTPDGIYVDGLTGNPTIRR